MSFQIDNGIRVTPKANRPGRQSVITKTLLKMKAGQSFWIPKYSERLVSSIHIMARRQNIKIVTRIRYRELIKGTRVWRVG